MSSDRIPRRMVLASLIGLAGCGLAPVYGSEDTLQGAVAFQATDSVAGFRLRSRLEDRLGRSTAPRYLLTVDLSSSRRAAAITADGDTSRINIIGTANWVLTNVENGQRLDSGKTEAFTSFSATGSTIATQSTRDDAEARLAIILADMIVSRLLVLRPEQPA